MNQSCIDLVKNFEGFRDQAYKDAVGVWTIGFGFTQGVMPGDLMTRAEAELRLMHELMKFETGVLQMVTRMPNPNQLGALTSFAYNLGLHSLKGSTLLRKFNAGDMDGAAAEFPKWTFAAGKVLSGLVKRRLAEKELFERDA